MKEIFLVLFLSQATDGNQIKTFSYHNISECIQSGKILLSNYYSENLKRAICKTAQDQALYVFDTSSIIKATLPPRSDS